MKKARILVVEDEADIRELMLLHLGREGHAATAVENGEDALRFLQAQSYDLVVLDWMLPGVSGLEICKRIRAGANGRQVAVLMVTARADTADVVLGLGVGADDYLIKPFEIPIFTARVSALLRRAELVGRRGSGSRGSAVLRIGGLELDPEAHEVRCKGEPVSLTPSEFKLLHALMQNRGRVLSRDRLIELVQGEGVVVVDRAIDTHVFGLRKKLGPCSEIVETIRGVGYRVKAE